MFACCDESGIHKKSRWWVIGAIWLPDDSQLPRFEAAATELRQQSSRWGEIKWDKVNPGVLDTYQAFLQLVLGVPDMRFTSMVIDTQLLSPEEMRQYHPSGGRDEAYVKFMRLLLKHRLSVFAGQGHREFTVLYDRLSVKRDLADGFRSMLKRDMLKLAIANRGRCRFKHLSQMNSKGLHMMQAVDLLTGATWSAWAREPTAADDKPDPARQAIRDQISAWAGASLTYTGFPRDRYYNLWCWRPGKS